jgi:predicted amidohydrolase YtcJ
MPTVADALAASPLGSACAAHDETRRGIIEAGRDADLVAAITGTRVVATVVNGRVVHGEGAA